MGSKKRSRCKLCRDWNLDWTQSKFRLLDILFNVDLDGMVELNHKEKLK